MLPDATALSRLLSGAGLSAEVEVTTMGPVAHVEPHAALEALAALKAGGFESLMDFDGTDTGETVELTWRVRSYTRGGEVYLKATVGYDGEIASVWTVYPSALMPERETAELFGLRLSGHPNPKRLLTTDGVPPLLRKDVPIRTPEEARRR